MTKRTRLVVTFFLSAFSSFAGTLDFQTRLETVMEHDDGKFLWYHPRVAAFPGSNGPAVLMTLQKHLNVSDYYSGLFTMVRTSPEATWSGPLQVPELDWRHEANGITISVADVTPGWHAPSGKILVIGCRVPYGKKGEQLDDRPRSHQTVYAIYDPKRASWSSWQLLEMPAGQKFNFCRNACSQWLVKPDGTLLIPLYFGPDTKQPYAVTVAECSFDGERLRYLRHGDELTLPIARGLYEPSIVSFNNRYFLTLRNDERGYVTSGDDGLHWRPVKPWQFDDGGDLGNYNTQQHWLAHSDGLFLVYTRRGAGNDHIIRHRAPLFMAQVDPDKLQVLRHTERIVVSERGAELGNFGASAIDSTESWITVSEGVWSDDARKRGAKGATFISHVQWSKPNRLVAPQSAPNPAFRVANFQADVTVPIGHGMMGGSWLSKTVADPLEAHGLVLFGTGQPIVFVSVDWCEIRNDAYERWQKVLAEAAGTVAERVLVTTVHQHDAPVADLEAERLLRERKLAGTICDPNFHERAVQRVAAALRESLKTARPFTHIGTGQAEVEKIASNRRYTTRDGKVHFDRMSSTRNLTAIDADEGVIDPWLKTLSFWDGDTPLAAVSFYAVQPMSYYGAGDVSADFPGIARRQRQSELPQVAQIYCSGCSGNLTAGKYNTGAHTNRAVLAERLRSAMAKAWRETKRQPVSQFEFRTVPVTFKPRSSSGFSQSELEEKLSPSTKPFQQCLAAMGLSWRKRVAEGRPIQIPTIDFGFAHLLLLPGESYVEFQRAAQEMRPDSFVCVAGYGDGATGYIPTEKHFAEHDSNLEDWCWVAPGSEERLTEAIETVLEKPLSYYSKEIVLGGMPIAGSSNISDNALREAAWIVGQMLTNRPEILHTLASNKVRLAVMAFNEFTTDVPEHSTLTPKVYWDRRARGLGATPSRPAVSCAEENLLCYPGDPYETENILVHEFGHAIHEMAMRDLDRTFDRRLRAAFMAATNSGLWKGTYAGTDHLEYWAEAVQDWFDNNRENDALHNSVNTRTELKEYDPAVARLCAEVFGEIPWRYKKPLDRPAADRAHLVNYDPGNFPRFKWRVPPIPERPRALIQTRLGDIEVELDAKRAPQTVSNFLYYAHRGLYANGMFHRAVTLSNQPNDRVKIEVIQAAANPARTNDYLPPILLERTRDTALRHVNGAISMARDGPDTAQDSFFICIGDQPELDFGGKRNPDGQGFAAFGKVIKGMDVVRQIQQAKTDGQTLTRPILIQRSIRLN